MNEPSLDIFYNRLVQVLIQDMVYYIPSEIIPEHLVNQVYSIGSHGFFDEILVLDVKHGLLPYEIDKFNTILFEKRALLEKNLFRLLSKKDEIKLIEFDYTLEKYFKQVEFYYSITNWLNMHLRLYNGDKINNFIVGAFQLQNSYYKKHFEDLIDHFYAEKDVIFKGFYNVQELVESYFPDLLARYGVASENLTEKEEVLFPEGEFSETGESELQTKKKKKVFITEKEADDFILESVFDISVLNEK